MAAIALFMMTASCSSDDSNETVNETPSLLIKKMIITDEDGYEETINYYYDGGNKITNELYSDGWKVNYTYTGDLITQVDYYNEEQVLDQTNKYEYNSNDQLVSFTILLFNVGGTNPGHKTLYTYGDDNTITAEYFYGDHASQTSPTGEATIVLENGNFTALNHESGSTVSYSYDDKNNPFKNIIGYNAVNLSYEEGGINNPITNINTNSIGDQTFNATYTYDYNSDNFPTKCTYVNQYGSEVIQYFYE